MKQHPGSKPLRIVYIASNNRHKQEELAAMAGPGFDLRLISELPIAVSWEETGTSFVENARIKALAVKAATPHAVLGDDSGLMVDGLNGRPGVYSSRYAGEDATDQANNTKLLAEMTGIPASERYAKFVCTLCFLDEAGVESVFTGECHGTIAAAPQGTGGFGYDPLFLVEGREATMADLTPDEKNALSHRRRAIDAWLAALA